MKQKTNHPPLPKTADENVQFLRQDLVSVALAATPSHRPRVVDQSRATPTPSRSHGLLAPLRNTVESPLPSAGLRLLQIQPSDSQDTQRHALVEWMRGFSVETANHQSSIVSAELLLHQIAEGTKELQHPNLLRTSAMCCVAQQLMESMPRYAPVLRPVLNELFEAVYAPVSGGAPSQEFIASSLANLGLGYSEIARLQKFLTRKPYFEGLKESQLECDRVRERMHALSERQGRGHLTFTNAITAWQTSFLRCVFVSWRAIVAANRKNRYLLNGFFRHVNRRDVLLTHFFSWRAFTKDAMLDRLRLQYQEGIDQVVQQEAMTNAKFLEAEDAREELQLQCLRLKENEGRLTSERVQMQVLTENSIVAAEGWRSVSIDVVNFMASLRKIIATSHNMAGERNYAEAYELGVKIILGWAMSLVGHLPQASKVRNGNFLQDVRDGILMLLVLHVVTGGEVSLAVLDRKDAPSRMQVVLDALGTLNIHLFLQLEHLTSSPSADVFFLIFYHLWDRFALPPLADSSVCIGYSNGFRNDLSQTREYLDLMKAFYPSWFEQRRRLQHYALYVTAGRSHGGSATVAANEQNRIRQELLSRFQIPKPLLVPAVFLSSASLNPTQRFQNDEELLRVNEVISRHIALFDSVFHFYSYDRAIFETTVKGRLPVQGMPKKKRPIDLEKTQTGFRREMDIFSFFRFCADCGIIDDQSAPPSPTAGAGAQKKKPQRGPQAAPEKISKDPVKFSKIQIHELFLEVVSKFRDEGDASPAPGVVSSVQAAGSAPAAQAQTANASLGTLASPVAFSTLLLNLAVQRHGQPVMPSSMQPAPGSVFLETLVNGDMAPWAAAPPALPFVRELFTDGPQSLLAVHRSLLRQAFATHASRHNKTGMTLTDWGRVMSIVLGLDRKPTASQSEPGPWSQSVSVEHDHMERMLQDVFLAVTDLFLKKPARPAPEPTDPSKGVVEGSTVDAPLPDPNLYLVYGEFEVALAAIAVQLRPSPFQALPSKLEDCLRNWEDALNEIVYAVAAANLPAEAKPTVSSRPTDPRPL